MKSIKVKKVDLKKISFLVFPIGKIRKLVFFFFVLFNCNFVTAQDVISNASQIYISEGTEVVGLDDFVQDNESRNVSNTSVTVYVTKGTSFFVPSDKFRSLDNVVYLEDSSQKAYIVSKKVDVKSKVQRKAKKNDTVTCWFIKTPFKFPFSTFFQIDKFLVITTSPSFSFKKFFYQQIVDFSFKKYLNSVNKPEIKSASFFIVFNNIVKKFTTRPPPFFSF